MESPLPENEPAALPSAAAAPRRRSLLLGLLVGAAMTQRPELFRAVVCSYPLLDMIRYQQFFVARYWVPEYGSADDAAQFPALRAYSPYHHVEKGVRYPAVLFISGDGDTRVAPASSRPCTRARGRP